MKRNLILFIWFFKFGLLKQRDEYNVHDHIKSRFCPEYITPEEFDDKEQLLRDSPGPAGIKYAFFVGGRTNGLPGAVSAVLGLFIPVVAAAFVLWLLYANILTVGRIGGVANNAFAGMHAVTAGLIVAQMYKIVYFNKTGGKNLLIIIISALVFVFVNGAVREYTNEIVLTPLYVAAVIGLGIVFGFVRDRSEKREAVNPNKKYIDPYSKKGIKMRDRQLMEEEQALRKYIDDDTIKRRREELEKERLAKEERNRKFRDGG